MLQGAVDRYLANLGKARSEPGTLGEFLSTHPRHEVRVEEVARIIAALPPGERRLEGDGRFTGRWLEGTAGVRALAPAYARYDRARLAAGEKDLAAAETELRAAIG